MIILPANCHEGVVPTDQQISEWTVNQPTGPAMGVEADPNYNQPHSTTSFVNLVGETSSLGCPHSNRTFLPKFFPDMAITLSLFFRPLKMIGVTRHWVGVSPRNNRYRLMGIG